MIVWLNGEFIPQERASISIFDRGLLFGDGLFETIRMEKEKPLWIREHLGRLKKGLKFLKMEKICKFFDNLPSIIEIIEKLYVLNRERIGNLGRLKILVTRGRAKVLGLPAVENPAEASIAFILDPYSPPGDEEYEKGWHTYIVNKKFGTPLASFKSLNYLFYLWAREEAKKHKAQEAIIKDLYGNIAEASSASLIAYDGNIWITFKSPYRLSGITEKKLIKLLKNTGERVLALEVKPAQLRKCKSLWLLNSLIGIMPVRSVNGIPFDPLSEKASDFRKLIFSM